MSSTPRKSPRKAPMPSFFSVDPTSSSTSRLLVGSPAKSMTPMNQRRARNIEKHNLFLQNLGIDIHKEKPRKRKEAVVKKKLKVNVNRGLKFLSDDNNNDSVTDDFENLVARWPYRSKELKLLNALVSAFKVNFQHMKGGSSMTMVQSDQPAILVTGGSGTGKTHLIKDVVLYNQVKYVYINCKLCHTVSDVYGSILTKLSGQYRSCNSLHQFQVLIRSTLTEPAVLVLDECEHFVAFQDTRTPILAQLFLLSTSFTNNNNLNLMVIGITSSSLLSYARVVSDCGKVTIGGNFLQVVNPIQIHFDAYPSTKPEVFRAILHLPRIKAKIITNNNNISGSNDIDFLKDQIYKLMIDTLLQSVLSSTRDVSEVMRLSRTLWPDFLQLFNAAASKQQGDDKNNNGEGTTMSTKLRSVIIKEARPFVSQLLTECLFHPTKSIVSNALTEYQRRMKIDSIPESTKYLILACYLCQHNAPTKDARLYTTSTSSKKRRKGSSSQSTTAEESTTHFMQRTGFALERMLSIFTSIFKQDESTDRDSRDMGTTNLFQQISELKSLGYISLARNPIEDSTVTIPDCNAMYRCTISYDMAIEISKSLNFDLQRYLI